MASSSQRARFLLEQTVPELQELLSKGIFSQEEVSSIARKRSDFEHLLNARESTVYDHVRYLAYEQTLEKLKAKRIKRLGARNFTHNSQRRLFALFERATRKFPGDLRLWILYLRYARFAKAHKRIGKILTALLRLQPNNADLWIVAARFTAYGQDDVNTGRSYIQRGLRFSPKERRLWLELTRLELSFVQKANTQLENLGVKSLADITEPAPESSYFDERALQQMSSTPVISGGIVQAVFDAAMKEFDNDESLAEDIFNRIAEFPLLKCTQRLLTHILEFLKEQHPTSSSTAACMFQFSLVGVKPTSPEYLLALGKSIQSISALLESETKALEVAEKLSPVFFQLSVQSDDLEVQQALQTSLNYMLRIVVEGKRLPQLASHLQDLDVKVGRGILTNMQLE